MGGHPLELLEFDEGESRRETAFAAYVAARETGTVTVQRFLDFRKFAEAVRHLLAQRPADEKLDIFVQDSERKGVYRSTAEAVGEFAAKLLSYDGNSILIAAENADHGWLLDLEEGAHGPAIVEL